MRNAGREPSDLLPAAIVEAFRKDPLMPFPQLAKLLGMHRKTLREHVRAGHIPWRQKGLGKTSPRRVFTLSDVAVLLAYMQRQFIKEYGQSSMRDGDIENRRPKLDGRRSKR